MFSYAVKAVLFCSAVHLAGGSPLLSGSVDAVLAKRQDWGSSTSVSASVSAQVMVQGWSMAADAAGQCQSVFEAHASVDVAFEAATSFVSRVNEVNSQYGQCACNGPSAAVVSAQFQATITKLFRSWQVILQTGQEQYGNDWNTRFKPVFQSLSPAFVTMKNHFASLNIDLAAFLRVTLLDLNLFLAVGIDINVLLGLNLSIGGLLTL
ncbi:hypothetical protein Pst134EA_005589 [Puccinia striiformis f. sp. tritici]|uniref:hypothetical protein n=1 Tax=Puccinia striiformis f. sp. tritici TaxID=168172 RepID=UPI002007537D|nr:hypothetical protein Pst134EA_005589 [Puccinia striiformis f. sp. tritici]KAH9471710.1 hypothetical protein Pst134EA_005589 [Puccinia striiformis f. sp. tritici]